MFWALKTPNMLRQMIGTASMIAISLPCPPVRELLKFGILGRRIKAMIKVPKAGAQPSRRLRRYGQSCESCAKGRCTNTKYDHTKDRQANRLRRPIVWVDMYAAVMVS